VASILVIDDDALARERLAARLRYAGHDVREARDVDSALAAARDADLVVTNVLMPQKEGLEVIPRLREQRPDLPIVGVLGGPHSESSGRQEARGTAGVELSGLALDLGATRVIEAPLVGDQLERTVRALL
jgi:CheY-like chemotaxis protein